MKGKLDSIVLVEMGQLSMTGTAKSSFLLHRYQHTFKEGIDTFRNLSHAFEAR